MTTKSEHIETSRMLRRMETVQGFNDLLDLCTISETDKEILRLHYIQDHDFRFIGDCMGYSETTIKSRHREAVRKIAALMKGAAS